MSVTKWMCWEGGIDLVAVTSADLQMPNVIIHLGRMVNTPIGSAPSGMILWQPDSAAMPVVMGFVSTSETVGNYFGANIFAGTPFEMAPTLMGNIHIEITTDRGYAKCEAGGHIFEVEMTNLGSNESINRPASAFPPFSQQVLEQVAGTVVLKVDGVVQNIIVPPIGITGGPAAVVSACGLYAR
jgi:hypothetical protein